VGEKRGIIMKTLANELRNLVVGNSLELGRLTEQQVGKEDYKELTKLYRNALDMLTEWASADYSHKATQEHISNAFEAVKAILALYETDDNRIAIDNSAMHTMRDLSTQPKRQYSEKYKKAEKARKAQEKTAIERYEDLITMGVEAPTEIDVVELIKGIKDKAEIKPVLEVFINDVKTSKVVVTIGTTNMLEMFENALATLIVKTKAVDDIKADGNWTWRRPEAVNEKVFADLVENYVADCLIDGYNIKTTKTIREEKKAERDAKKLAKDKKEASVEA
jgi:hypothetical protein